MKCFATGFQTQSFARRSVVCVDEKPLRSLVEEVDPVVEIGLVLRSSSRRMHSVIPPELGRDESLQSPLATVGKSPGKYQLLLLA